MKKLQTGKDGDMRERLIHYIKNNETFYMNKTFNGYSDEQLVILKVEIEMERQKQLNESFY